MFIGDGAAIEGLIFVRLLLKFEDLTAGRHVLNSILCLILLLREIGWVGMDWIDLAQDRDKWRALVNTVMNLRVP
jgi:hypothetical protein